MVFLGYEKFFILRLTVVILRNKKVFYFMLGQHLFWNITIFRVEFFHKNIRNLFRYNFFILRLILEKAPDRLRFTINNSKGGIGKWNCKLQKLKHTNLSQKCKLSKKGNPGERTSLTRVFEKSGTKSGATVSVNTKVKWNKVSASVKITSSVRSLP